MQFFIQLLQKSGLFLFFVLLQCISLFLWSQSNQLADTYIGKKIISANGYISEKTTYAKSFLSLDQENKKLQQANATLQKKIYYYQNQNQNKPQFTKKDTLEKVYQYTYLPVKIITNSINKQNNSIIINRGYQHGIRKGMGVVTERGIVGSVKHVSNKYAAVQSLLSAQLKTTAQIKNDQNFGTLIWEGKEPNVMLLTELSKFIQVNKNDTIQTYGGRSIYPRFHPIGTVDTVFINPTDGTNNIRVNLFEDFTRLQNAYVVKNIDIEEIIALEDSINQQQQQ